MAVVSWSASRKPIITRKNLSNIHAALTKMLRNKQIKPGDRISSSFVVSVIGIETCNQWFNRADWRCDDVGPARSIGDLLGGHGLQLRKSKPGVYVVPSKLPVIKNDCLLEHAVYPC